MKLKHSICPLCGGPDELELEKVGNKMMAYCPKGGTAKRNKHTLFEVTRLEIEQEPDGQIEKTTTAPDKLLAERNEVDELEEV